MLTMSDEKVCPDCGGHISTAVGFGWMDDRGTQTWVGTCLDCNRRTGQDTTFGLDASGALIWVRAFPLDE